MLRGGNFFRAVALSTAMLLALPTVAPAQRIKQDPNGRLEPELGGVKASPEEQIKVGRQAVGEVYKQMPVLPDSSPITRYVQRLGNQLAAKAPGYRWPFQFHVIAQKEINAFALPGGPIFVNLGTIQTADESELAGVMAHEISHVVMQHTARDAGKEQMTQGLGAIGGAILGSLIGGGLGQVVGGAVQMGAGAFAMKYSRADENEADLLGSQIMYDAGYNPYSLVEFFQKLGEQGGGGGPQFLSDHPNPGNRAESVQRVISKFPPKSYPRQDSSDFVAMKREADRTKTYTAQQIQQHKGSWNNQVPSGVDTSASSGEGSYSGGSASIENVSYSQVRPQGGWKQFNQGGLRFDYPANWEVMGGQTGIVVGPRAGVSQQGAIAYGATMTAVKGNGSSLDSISRQVAEDTVNSNEGMRIIGGPNRLRVNGADGVSYDLVGTSPIRSGRGSVRERDWLVTVQRSDGSVAVIVFVSPDRDYNNLKTTWQSMLRSLHLE